MRDLPNLDFLRAVAVLSVIAEHILLAYGVTRLGYWQVRWMGVVGVFIFFVHTSLVLMWSLERKPHTLDFYIRRVFRIYPLALVAIAVTLLFHAPVNGTPDAYFQYQPPPSHLALAGAIGLIPNIISGYLPMSVLWSLPYEIEMYVALPVLFFFVRRNFSLWPLLLFWILLVLVSRPLFPGVGHNFFLCIPYFLPGVMAYVGFGRTHAKLRAWCFPVCLLLVWSIFMIDPGWRSASLLCLAVGLGLPWFKQVSNPMLIKASHSVAKYSYGLYLAHPFSIVLGLYLLPHRPLAMQLGVILISLAAFSVGAYHLLEKPLIRFGSRFAAYAEKRYEQYHAEHFIPANGEIS